MDSDGYVDNFQPVSVTNRHILELKSRPENLTIFEENVFRSSGRMAVESQEEQEEKQEEELEE